MRKIQILGLALFAMFAFSAIAAGSAFAADNWNVKGLALKAGEEVAAETEGELELIVLEGATTVLSTVKCSGIFVGLLIGPNTDDVTEVLNLAEESTSTTVLTGLAINCTVTQTAGGALDCTLNALAEVWAVNLPWSTDLELMTTSETFLDLFLNVTGKTPGYEVSCPTPLGTFTETCEGETSALLVNEPGTVPASILGTFNANSEKANCAVLGSGKGDNIGQGNTWANKTGGLANREATAVE